MRGIEPPCAAWEAAVLPLNYTRNVISDFRFSIADCNRNKLPAQFGCLRRKRYRALPQRTEALHGNEILSAEDSGRYSRGLGDNHCHEITSSELVKIPSLLVPSV